MKASEELVEHLFNEGIQALESKLVKVKNSIIKRLFGDLDAETTQTKFKVKLNRALYNEVRKAIESLNSRFEAIEGPGESIDAFIAFKQHTDRDASPIGGSLVSIEINQYDPSSELENIGLWAECIIFLKSQEMRIEFESSR